MSSYNELIDELSTELSIESNKVDDEIKTTVILEDEKDGTTVLGNDIRTVLDRNSVRYIIESRKKIKNRELENAVYDGVYKEEFDDLKKKKVRIVYSDTMNVSGDVDIYVVQSDDLANSMEHNGLRVARYPNQLIEMLKEK